MAALAPEKLAEITPSLLTMLANREAALIEWIALLGDLGAISSAAEVAEGEHLIAQGCERVRQAIIGAAPQDASAS